MICEEYKCIFVHIPKAAGQSIEHFFVELVGLTWKTRAPLLLRYNNDPSLGPERLAHLTASEYTSCGHMDEDQFNAYFKFSFVRNPWDRIVSEYKYRAFQKKFDFKTFLFKHFPTPGFTDSYRHIIPQYEFLFDHEGNQLVDYIGRFENLQQDFNEVCRRLQIEEATLPHKKKSSENKRNKLTAKDYLKTLANVIFKKKTKNNIFQSYTEYYDEETKEFVAKLYDKDIRTFKYKFGQ